VAEEEVKEAEAVDEEAVAAVVVVVEVMKYGKLK